MGLETVIVDISSEEKDRRETAGGCNRKAGFASSDDEDDDCVILDPDECEILDPDECVILDADPAEAVSKEKAMDDLVVVGSKGEVACRDFPHSRHLCANYAFDTTPHEKHCEQCYCYVCDKLAPCVHWGYGNFILDHCHATHKIQFWTQRRQICKKLLSTTKATQF